MSDSLLAAALASPRKIGAPEGFMRPSPRHTHERCKECGLWVAKARPCVHCLSRPNRIQADIARAKANVPQDSPGSSFRGHSKERCSSCGLWKSKKWPKDTCLHCETRPNRHQAAKVRHPGGLALDGSPHIRSAELLSVAHPPDHRLDASPLHPKER